MDKQVTFVMQVDLESDITPDLNYVTCVSTTTDETTLIYSGTNHSVIS